MWVRERGHEFTGSTESMPGHSRKSFIQRSKQGEAEHSRENGRSLETGHTEVRILIE